MQRPVALLGYSSHRGFPSLSMLKRMVGGWAYGDGQLGSLHRMFWLCILWLLFINASVTIHKHFGCKP